MNTNIDAVRRILRNWGKVNYQDFPWRRPEKKWHGLIAEILLQRTRANSVIGVYRSFINRFPEPIDLALTDKSEVKKIISPLGLNWRAKVIHDLGNALHDREQLPETYEELIKLPGIGDYVASTFLSFHLNKYSILLDTNTVRFSARINGQKYDGETRRKKWVKSYLEELTPPRAHRKFNFSLLDFSMLVCKPSKPLCIDCPFSNQYCQYSH